MRDVDDRRLARHDHYVRELQLRLLLERRALIIFVLHVVVVGHQIDRLIVPLTVVKLSGEVEFWAEANVTFVKAAVVKATIVKVKRFLIVVVVVVLLPPVEKIHVVKRPDAAKVLTVVKTIESAERCLSAQVEIVVPGVVVKSVVSVVDVIASVVLGRIVNLFVLVLLPPHSRGVVVIVVVAVIPPVLVLMPIRLAKEILGNGLELCTQDYI